MLAKSHTYIGRLYVINGYCTDIRRSTESRQVTLAECCEQGNEISRYIQGSICLSKKLLLLCSYIFTRAGKFTKRNINLFMSYCNIEVPTRCTCYRVYFYLMIALHVSGIIITNLQEHKATVTTASGNYYTVIDRVLLLKSTHRLD
jgi:hypothetical protein